MILSFAFFAHADIAGDLNQECSTNPEIVKQKGPSGTCRVVLAPKPIVTRGACRGQSGDLVCIAAYHAQLNDSSMKLICYKDLSNPIIDTTFPIKASAMDSAFIIRRPDGANFVVSNDKQYLNFSSENVVVTVVEDKKKRSGNIVLMTEKGPVIFENAFCRKL
jgi:hypothetical protein